jgi:hypothetical protein
MRVKDKDGKEEVGAKKKFATRQLLFVATKPYFTIASLICSSTPHPSHQLLHRQSYAFDVVPTFDPRFPAVNICISGTFFFFVHNGILRRVDNLVRIV